MRMRAGDEPIWHDGQVVGWVTSGAYGHSVGRSLALGYVPGELAGADAGFEIEIIGERRAGAARSAPQWSIRRARACAASAAAGARSGEDGERARR